MRFAPFVAFRMIKSDASASYKKKATKPILYIAIASVAIGVAVMILSLGILNGFQNEIRNKVIGFGGHIRIVAFENGNGTEQESIYKDEKLIAEISSIPQVQNIQTYAQKPGILKTKDDILGVVFKGVDESFNWHFFEKNLVSGSLPDLNSNKTSNSIIISKKIASKMELETGQKMLVYFTQNGQPRPRNFTITGIYHTGMAGFDDLYLLGDIRHIQRINGWNENNIGGIEVNLKNYNDILRADELVYGTIPYNLSTSTIRESNPEIFAWLELQDINVIIIITLVFMVSAINMTTALLILILEKTSLIGILKALGADNWQIRKIFLLQAAYLIGLGLFWGNLFGLGTGLIQHYHPFIELPQESYYLTHVPVHFNSVHIILLNLGTLIFCTLSLIIPSYIVTKISPVKAIRFNA